MLLTFATALVLCLACQPQADRQRAEELARSGRTVEALALFEQVVAGNPADVEARLWIARLQLRLGRTADAEAGFRAVVREQPSDVDARIGLANALMRRNAWKEALAILLETEKDAGANSEMFAALARAYRRSGDDRAALNYYRRAATLAPRDPDIAEGFEATARAYSHSVAIEGFGENDVSGTRSGALTAVVRLQPRLQLEGYARVQARDGSSDALAGGGAILRVHRSTSIGLNVVGGRGNTSLPVTDTTAAVSHYAGSLEFGASARWLSYADASVVALSPLLAMDVGAHWRFDTRYTYSVSEFDGTSESSGDHSVMVRETWSPWHRFGLTLGYAYGIESFENLTADRLDSLGTSTFSAGVRVRLPSLMFMATTWEHQWRSNDTRVQRVTVGVGQTWK